MFRRWVALAAFGCPAALACGERYGDPIVAVERQTNAAGAATGGDAEAAAAGGTTAEPVAGGGRAGEGRAGEGGEGTVAETEAGPTGLCGACVTSETCGDANDACLRHQGETESFCGRDCDEGFGCPDGYSCVELANSLLWQCVATSACPAAAPTPPSHQDIREYLLARINAERVARDRLPLSPSPCLDGLAQESALDYARSDVPLGKYRNDCEPVWPDCDCGWSGEAEVAVAHYGLDWATAIELALGTYRDPPDDGFIDSFLDFDFTDVGIGFWISGDEAWIALSFR